MLNYTNYFRVKKVYSSVWTDISIYPNPASESITVRYKFGETTEGKVHILTLTGAEVGSFNFEGISGTQEIPLSNLTNGIYLVQIILSNGQIITEKLVIFKE